MTHLVIIGPEAFDPALVAPETTAFNAMLGRVTAHTDDVAALRAGVRAAVARAGGGTPYVAARASVTTVDADHGPVPVRVVRSSAATSGVYLHMHFGGFVTGGADLQDAKLERIAEATGLTVVSVDYRLAPEHPHPAGLDDCHAVARMLVRESGPRFGTDRLLIGGESSGANLAVGVLLRLRDEGMGAAFTAANLLYGPYDLSLTPSARRHTAPGLLTTEALRFYAAAYVPDQAQRRSPTVSPLYADLAGLPPTLLTVGTSDPVLDDSLFLHARLLAAGVPSTLHVAPGAGHGFDTQPVPPAAEATTRILAFLARPA
jgi:acetyl esterase